MLVACLCRNLGLNPSRQPNVSSRQLLQVLQQQQKQGLGWASQMHRVTASKLLLLLLLLKVVVAAAHRGVCLSCSRCWKGHWGFAAQLRAQPLLLLLLLLLLKMLRLWMLMEIVGTSSQLT
jgi:hypothetical protein